MERFSPGEGLNGPEIPVPGGKKTGQEQEENFPRTPPKPLKGVGDEENGQEHPPHEELILGGEIAHGENGKGDERSQKKKARQGKTVDRLTDRGV